MPNTKQSFAMDENGKVHSIKMIAGQKLREEYTTGRVVFALVLYVVIVRVLAGIIHNTYLLIAAAILLILIVRTMVLHVTVTQEEIDRYKKRSKSDEEATKA